MWLIRRFGFQRYGRATTLPVTGPDDLVRTSRPESRQTLWWWLICFLGSYQGNSKGSGLLSPFAVLRRKPEPMCENGRWKERNQVERILS
jgi:hypothetical protein